MNFYGSVPILEQTYRSGFACADGWHQSLVLALQVLHENREKNLSERSLRSIGMK